MRSSHAHASKILIFGTLFILLLLPCFGMLTSQVEGARENVSGSITAQVKQLASAQFLTRSAIPRAAIFAPTLGNYSDTTVQLGANAAITPDAVPSGATSINVSSSVRFKGKLTADPATGVVRVTNARPAGTHIVTIKAFDSVGAITTTTFMLTVNTPFACASLSFLPPTSFAAGTAANGVGIGDFNNDGNQDFAVASQTSFNVTVWLGNGAGGFTSGATFGTGGGNPFSVTIGDLNNDGKQDIVVCNRNTTATSLALLMGNGLGGFTLTNLSGGTSPTQAVIGDFNNDGKPDIAASNNTTPHNVRLLLGNGAGGFSLSGVFPVNATPNGIAMDDFNGDNNLDVVTSGAASVSILLGNGAGSFASAVSIPAPANTSKLTTGDFNGDNRADIAYSSFSASMGILLNNGAGGFTTAATFTGGLTNGLDAGDIDGDGNQDVAFTNSSGSNNVVITRGNGAGGFSALTALSGGTFTTWVAMGDFNNDGKQDLVSCNSQTFNALVFLSNCAAPLVNTAPTFQNVFNQTRTQGTPVSNSQIATVTDVEQAANTLTVTVNDNTSATVNGVTVSNITVNAAGAVNANVVAACEATNASFTLKVTDSAGLNNTATLNVTVDANTPPTLTYSNQSVGFNGSLTVSPSFASDNGSVTYTIESVTPPLAIAPTVNSVGVVSIADAQPSGSHVITVRATDNCGAITDSSFTLDVAANPPTLGNYANATVNLSGNIVVIPDAVPTNTTGISVSTSIKFKGVFSANLATGAVRVVNAYPAGAYTVTVKAFGAGGMTSRTFVLTVNGGTPCVGPTPFITAPNVPTDPFPNGLAVGDFNEDGHQDFVNAYDSFASPTVHFGNGAGGFPTTKTFSAEPFVKSIAVGDFNEDGHQDLALSNNSGPRSVSIRLGDGAGNFSGTTNVPTGNIPETVVIGDFNNDGHQDFATSNRIDDTVSIRFGDGAGNFTGTTEISVDEDPEGIAIGDFNNDGNQDFATANFDGTSVSIRLGNGLGGFTSMPDVPLPVSAFCLVIADFNEDNKPDVVASGFNQFGNFASVRLGDGAGNFTGTTDVPVSAGTQSMVTGDFNNDGHHDFATANINFSTISMRFGDGAGNFIGPTPTSEIPVSQNPIKIALGDFNGDGKQDFVTIDFNSPAIASIRLNNSCPPVNNPPTITAAEPLSRQQGHSAINSQIATVNDTDQTEETLTVTATPLSGSGVTINNIIVASDGTVTADVAASCAATNSTFTLTVRDNQNATATATLTVNVTSNPPPLLGIYLTTSIPPGGSATIAPDIPPIDDGTITNITVSAPGFTGTLSVNQATGVVSITNAGPSGSFLVTVTATDNCGATTVRTFTLNLESCIGIVFEKGPGSPILVGPDDPIFISTGDFNRDAKTDLVVIKINSSDVRILLATGTGGFTPAPSPVINVPVSIDSSTVADFNVDGKPDIALNNAGANNLIILLGDGLGGFTMAGPPIQLIQGSFARAIAVADFNLDNKPDIVTANTEINNIQILLGNGMGGFTSAPGSPITVEQRPEDVVVGDFNLDNKADIAVTNTNSNNVTILLGNGMAGFAPAVGSPVAVGGQPDEIVMGDFNNDNKPDFVTGNRLSDTMSVLLGNGMGGFALTSASPIPIDFHPYMLAPPADFNLDGNLDVVVRVPITNHLVLMRGDGLGGFTLSNLVFDFDPFIVTSGDFNADGRPDLATGTLADDSVMILLNTCPQNMLPVVNTHTVSLDQGTTTSGAHIATVSDAEQAANTLNVTVTPLTGSGVTVNNINIDSNGNVTADVEASCSATNSTFTVAATDSFGGTTTATLNVNVNPNTPPSLSYANQSINLGGSINVNPTTATDNVSIVSYTVHSVVPALTTAPTVDANGMVSIINARPSGDHVITIRATDNCGATTDASFTLTVINSPPEIFLAPPVSIHQGVSINELIAGIIDLDQPGNTLNVVFTPLTGSGVTITNISIDIHGNVFADVTASCTATSSTFNLAVTDDQNVTVNATVTVNVIPNTPPVLGNYPTTTVAVGMNTTVTPDAAPADDLGITSLTVSAPDFAGTLTIDPVSGVITVSNASPVGSYTVTVTATDNCGATTTKTFTLDVICPTYTVNSLGDTGAGTGTTGDLRYCITQANAQLCDVTINIPITGVINLTSTLPLINNNITINGPGAALLDVHRNGSNAFRIFVINIETTVSINNMTISNGSGLRGGAIENQGTLTLTNCALTNNTSTGSALNNGGGAIYNNGTLNVIDSTFSGNRSDAGTNGAPGGAIYNFVGTVSLTNCTISGNTAENSSGSGIFISSGSVTLLNCTVTANGTENSSIAVHISNGTLNVKNSIVAGNLNGDVVADSGGTINDQDNNILSGDPLLAPLGNYGGSTQTHALCADSPARDAGNNTGAPETDQRGVERPVGETVDIGAFEANIFFDQSSIPSGTQFAPYAAETFTANGGVAPYTFTLIGTLPQGMTFSDGTLSGMPTEIGSFPIIIIATDGEGFAGTGCFTLIIECPVITLLPESLPNGTGDVNYNQQITASGGEGPYTFASTSGTLPPGLMISAAGVLSGIPTATGTYNFTITATAANECTGSREYTISINMPPTITALGPLTRERGAIATISQIALVTDAEQAFNTLNVTATPLTGTGVTISNITVDEAGNVTASIVADCAATNSTFTLKVTDNLGVMATATLTINTTPDAQPPVITCPANITQATDPNQCSAIVNLTAPSATDNCQTVGAVVCSPSPGSAFPKGITTVTCTISDASGNVGSCSFTVTVNDTQAPTISCPANITQNTDLDQCSAVVSFSQTASDNCPGVGTVTCKPASGSTFQKGVTSVTCSVTDASGNTNSCSFTVTVNDAQAPSMTCPANIVKENDNGQCAAVVNYTVPTATDNCPSVGAVTCSPSSGSVFPKGITTVTCSVTDASGNNRSCSFTVTVNDTQAPTISCPANITKSTDPNLCSAVVSFSPTANDNCSVSSVSCTPASGSTFPKGVTTVSCRATDSSGNQSSPCSFTVTVNDTQFPVITCPSNVTKSTDPNLCSAIVSYLAPAVSDNCPGIAAPVCSPPSGSAFPKGITTVTCTVKDASNNQSQCSFAVTVNDTQAPSIVCPPNQILTLANPNNTSVIANYPSPTYSDNCPGAGVVCSPPAGSAFPLGVSTVTCMVTDASGNQAACSFIVTTFNICLQDDSNPAIVVLFNSTTGDYLFCVNGSTWTGRGTVQKQGNIYTLTHNTSTRRVMARYDGSQNRGTASLQSPVGAIVGSINDRDTRNNTCACSSN